MKKTFSLSVQYADNRLESIASRSQIRRWVQSAIEKKIALTIRFVDKKEGQQLNKAYRQKDYATNVLTFVYDDFKMRSADIILCTDIVLSEARKQKKSVKDHLAHLIIHGTLHAQGYDHENDKDADKMEQQEIALLARFHIANPY